MTPEQYKELEAKYIHPKVLSINDLENKTNRTLMYGYNCDRTTYHVYLYEKEIYIVNYEETYNSKPVISLPLEDDSCFIPSKRTYIGESDFEFSKLLIQRGYTIAFTYSEGDSIPTYHGRLLPNHSSY